METIVDHAKEQLIKGMWLRYQKPEFDIAGPTTRVFQIAIRGGGNRNLLGGIFLGEKNEKIFGWWGDFPLPAIPPVGKILTIDEAKRKVSFFFKP